MHAQYLSSTGNQISEESSVCCWQTHHARKAFARQRLLIGSASAVQRRGNLNAILSCIQQCHHQSAAVAAARRHLKNRSTSVLLNTWGLLPSEKPAREREKPSRLPVISITGADERNYRCCSRCNSCNFSHHTARPPRPPWIGRRSDGPARTAFIVATNPLGRWENAEELETSVSKCDAFRPLCDEPLSRFSKTMSSTPTWQKWVEIW